MEMAGNNQKGQRKLGFDLNLVPFIDVLSTCICFLLITAVFLQLGTVNTRQAVGDALQSSQKDEPALWVKINDGGNLEVDVKNVKSSRLSRFVVQGRKAGPDFSRFEQSIASVKQTYPQLNIALILPAPQSRYADMIRVMDVVKKGAISQVGIAPL